MLAKPQRTSEHTVIYRVPTQRLNLQLPHHPKLQCATHACGHERTETLITYGERVRAGSAMLWLCPHVPYDADMGDGYARALRCCGFVPAYRMTQTAHAGIAMLWLCLACCNALQMRRRLLGACGRCDVVASSTHAPGLPPAVILIGCAAHVGFAILWLSQYVRRARRRYCGK